MPLAYIYKARTAIFLIFFLLQGCAGVRLIDNQVHSFAPQPVAAGASYRFERLPSQQAVPTAQDPLEALARAALAEVGLHETTPAALSVQVSAQQREVVQADTLRMGIGWGLGWGTGWRTRHGGVHGGRDGTLFPSLADPPLYAREVSLVMRDNQGKVVFESRASHEGVWSDSGPVFAAMLKAALQGFPTLPNGLRRVEIEIPR